MVGSQLAVNLLQVQGWHFDIRGSLLPIPDTQGNGDADC